MADTLTDTELFQHMFESSAQGILVVDKVGTILRTNDSLHQIFGYDKGELLHKNLEELIPKGQRKKHKDLRKNYAKKPKARPMGKEKGLWGLKKDGSQFPVDISLSPTTINNNELVIAFVSDNTDRLLAQMAISTNEERIEEAQSIAHVGSWSWNMQTNERYWSDEFYRICGLPPGDKRLNKETVTDFIHPEDRNAALEVVGNAIENKTPYYYEKRILRPDGTIRHVLAKGKVEYDHKGIPIAMQGTIEDITELKQAIFAHDKEKEMLGKYLDTAASIFLVINKDHNVQLVNKRGCEVLGCDADKIIGENWFQSFIPKEDRNQLSKLFDTILEGKVTPPDIYENWVTAKGSKRKLIRWRNAVLKADYGNAAAMISSGVDITKQKIAEDIAHTRNRALEAAGSGIIIADAQNPDNPIIYCNTAFTQMTGYRQSEILGKNCRFLQGDDRDQEEIRILASALEKGELCRVVLRNYKKDGTLFWNELSITPLYDENQKLTHFIGVQNDVTKDLERRKKLENYAETLEKNVAERTEELQATVQKLVESNLGLEDQILETKSAESKVSASQAILSGIVENFPKGIVAVISDSFELLYVEGQSLDEVELRSVFFEGLTIESVTVVSEEHKTAFKENVRQTIAGQRLYFETEYNKHFFAVNTTPLFDENKKVTSALFVYTDISEQKKIEQNIQNALKAEQDLNELKSRFISMASHEFRTPLSAILSSATLIGKQNEPGKEERREKHVARIKANVKNLVVILNDFLSLSKLEEGKVSVKPEYFDLIPFANGLIVELEGTLKEGQSIHLISGKKAIPVFLDSKLLNHILINLLSNAIKYSGENQEIQFEIETKKDKIRLSIIDQGIGIPLAEQKSLFERFFRAENVTNIQGTGLGLHIVKQYTELMDGTVNFKSKVGDGTTFNVELPLIS